MWLLYVDESGGYLKDDDHFVVAGVAVQATQVERITTLLEVLVQAQVRAELADKEIHAQHIRSGKGAWRRVTKDARHELLMSMSELLGKTDDEVLDHVLFGIVRSPEAIPSADPLERVFEELLLRFDQMLIRRGMADHGLVIADKSRYEGLIQPLTRKWRQEGTRFRRLRRIIEVPLFVDSEATRLIQLADCVAHGIYRYYRSKDPTYLDPMLENFDQVRGKMHGLVHLSAAFNTCDCYACESRR